MRDRHTLTIRQACEQVGVSRRTIYNWMSAGKIEWARTAGGNVRIFEDTLWRPPLPLRAGADNLPTVNKISGRGAGTALTK